MPSTDDKAMTVFLRLLAERAQQALEQIRWASAARRFEPITAEIIPDFSQTIGIDPAD